jgi:hypothetical protein
MNSATGFDIIAHSTNLIARPAWGWIPAGPFEYTPTPCRVDRGCFGSDDVFVIRRRSGRGFEYATITVCLSRSATVRGTGGVIAIANRAEPMHDTDAVLRVAAWGTRAAAAKFLSTI